MGWVWYKGMVTYPIALLHLQGHRALINLKLTYFQPLSFECASVDRKCKVVFFFIETNFWLICNIVTGVVDVEM